MAKAFHQQLNFDMKNPQVTPMHLVQLTHPLYNGHWATSWGAREL